MKKTKNKNRDAQKKWTSHKAGCMTTHEIALHLGGQISKKKNFGGVNKRFQT